MLYILGILILYNFKKLKYNYIYDNIFIIQFQMLENLYIFRSIKLNRTCLGIYSEVKSRPWVIQIHENSKFDSKMTRINWNNNRSHAHRKVRKGTLCFFLGVLETRLCHRLDSSGKKTYMINMSMHIYCVEHHYVETPPWLEKQRVWEMVS